MWLTDDTRNDWIGLQVDDRTGEKIGTIREVLIDPETELTWLRVQMGRFVRQFTLVPVPGEAIAARGHLQVDLRRYDVREAPRPITPDAWQTGSFRSLLYRHYGLTGLPRRRGARTLASAASA
jgi:hypothetical protein